MKLRFAVKTPLDTYPQLHSLHPFLVLSLPLFPFSIMALSWCFFLHLSLPDPWRPEAGYSCCLRLPQPITVPAETRAAQTPVIFHSLSWNPIYFLSPLTHSYSSCMTLADRSYLGSFLPSLQLAYLIYLCSSLMPFSKSCCLALFWTVCHALFLVQDSGNCMGSVWCFKRVNRSFCDIRIKAQFLFLMWWFNVKRDK